MITNFCSVGRGQGLTVVSIKSQPSVTAGPVTTTQGAGFPGLARAARAQEAPSGRSTGKS